MVRHRPGGGQRGEAGHEVHDAEEDARDLVEEIQNGPPVVPDAAERESEQNRE